MSSETTHHTIAARTGTVNPDNLILLDDIINHISDRKMIRTIHDQIYLGRFYHANQISSYQ
ncbi:hypothetical protein [Paenibacillus anaericanus]|uniref:hypothetical protein n=1 Tax=Paenibacillus anaericanus TaxID=170367 RepID=UPI0014776FC6|nr:hypothetical protein [Paenibacillus anaericanus]